MNTKRIIIGLSFILFTAVLSYGQDDLYDALVNHDHIGIKLSSGRIIYGRAIQQTGSIFAFKEDSTGTFFYYQFPHQDETYQKADYSESAYFVNPPYNNVYNGTIEYEPNPPWNSSPGKKK